MIVQRAVRGSVGAWEAGVWVHKWNFIPPVRHGARFERIQGPGKKRRVADAVLLCAGLGVKTVLSVPRTRVRAAGNATVFGYDSFFDKDHISAKVYTSESHIVCVGNKKVRVIGCE